MILRKVLLTSLVVISMWSFVTMETFQPSMHIYKDILMHSSITVEGGCDESDAICNRTCPFRAAFPAFQDILVNKGENCFDTLADVSLPPSSNQDATSIHFNTTSTCNDTTSSVNKSTDGHFSLSFWLKASCEDSGICMILQYGNLSLYMASSTELKLNARKIDVTKNTINDRWFYVVIRNNGQVFINGKQAGELFPVEQTDTEIVAGPQEVLNGTDYMIIADARFYSDVLTDREILEIYSADVLNIIETICRCPANAPTLVAGSETMCTDYKQTENVLRLNRDGGYSEYLNDGDTTTNWKSKSQQANMSVGLNNTFELAGIVVHGLELSRVRMRIQLVYQGKVMQQLDFMSDGCSSAAINCHDINSINGTTFEFNNNSINNRDEVSPFLAADEMIIDLMADEDNQISIGEIELHVRCHCSGNDPNCSVDKTDYTCDCSGNTKGRNCENCVESHFRETDEFSCSPCNCTEEGSSNASCPQVGGQCYCKSNVNESASRTCDVCNFNSIVLGSDNTNGCTQCECNPTGIHECTINRTCVCKDNVETETGHCNSCLPDFYGLQLPEGCLPCACDETGTIQGNVNQCHNITGQCDCKTNVIGRQCDTCKAGFYNLRPDSIAGCEDQCDCSFFGSINSSTCDIVTGNCACFENVQYNRRCLANISSIEPQYGPLAGGTVISINGVLLGQKDTSGFLYYINNINQSMTHWNSTLITIVTSPNSVKGSYTQSLVWSGNGKSYRPDGFDSLSFEYKPNPVLQSGRQFNTYASGGCRLKVRGNFMNSTHRPKIVIHTNTNELNECTPISDSEMTCATPDIKDYNQTGKISFGFIFDGYTAYRTMNDSVGQLTVLEDPVITSFTETFGNTFSTEIEIKGERLNSACFEDKKVLLGNMECEIKTISYDTIVCDPKETFPGTTRMENLVIVVGYLKIDAGQISFKDFWHTPGFIYIVIGVGCAILIVIVILVIYCVQRRRKTNETKRDSGMFDIVERFPDDRASTMATKGAVSNNYSPMGVINPIMAVTNPSFEGEQDFTDIMATFLERLQMDVKNKLKTSVVDRPNITPGNKCTRKGEKMRIINGTFNKASGKAGANLTIKTLVAPYSKTGEIPDWLQKGLLESTRMQDCSHENVLQSQGVSIDEKQIYVLYPEMSKRTLKDHLFSQSEAFATEKRLDICIQVAEGMNYLDGQHIVHKDLAARNCWVTEGEIVKISDASFTSDFYPDEYSLQNDTYIPIRWMAPESLRQSGFYHSKSDVWSFGVLMWEVFTNGDMPYHDITDDSDILRLVCDQQYRLGKPQDCSDRVFKVITLCHSEQSEDRPNFFILTNHLTNIISPEGLVSYVNGDGLAEELNGEMIYQNADVTLEGPKLPPRKK